LEQPLLTNIGFTLENTPKLLDFGLARIVDSRISFEESGDMDPGASAPNTTLPPHSGVKPITVTHGVVGTPMYLSPEAVANDPPDASFDLWNLTMVLYESIAGSNLMRRSTLQETLDCISKAAVPDLREIVPECPESVADFFHDALARDRASAWERG
jgi:serine/threonine protein kinase